MCPFICGVGVRAGGHVPPVPPYVAGPAQDVMWQCENPAFTERFTVHILWHFYLPTNISGGCFITKGCKI